MANSSSSSNIVNKAQEERSLWREKVEHTVRIAKERLKRKTNGFQILKEPGSYRQPPEMFTPKEWQFGLHNLDNADRYSATEAMKLCVPLLFGLDEVEKWEKFCDHVVPDHTKMLGCYGLHKEDINLTEKEIKQLLALDALCIAWKIDVWDTKSGEEIIWRREHLTVPKDEHRMFISGVKMWRGIFNNDMWRVENQIPLELITRAIEYIKTPLSELDRESDRRNGNGELWMKQALRTIISTVIRDVDVDDYAQGISDLKLSETCHILDGAHKVICEKDGLERKCEWGALTHIPSTIQLKHVGVKIEGVAKPLSIMSYNNTSKYLILPKIKIYDDTFAFIQNMARYEVEMEPKNNMFCDYILMFDLIMTSEDMDYLIKCGVVDNGCGTRAFEKWQILNEGFPFLRTSKEHNAMKEDIRRRYHQKLPKLWREFRTLFCSRPWLIVPVIATTLVTIATLIQTYTAIIGSDRMMPHYKNP